MSILRAVLGASFGATRTIPITPPDPDRPPRLDPEVHLVATSDDEWTITVGVNPYGLDDHNLLSEVRAYIIPEGHGLPSSAADYVASSYAFESVNMRSSIDGANVVLPLPDVPEGKYYGQLVLMLDDQATEPDPAPPPPSEDGPAPSDEFPQGEPEAPTTG